MYKQSEGFSQRRHISPDSYGKLDKLNLIQENLSLAATTIQALKQERDKLKESLIRGHPKTSKKEDSQNTHSEDIKKRNIYKCLKSCSKSSVFLWWDGVSNKRTKLFIFDNRLSTAINYRNHQVWEILLIRIFKW